MPTSPLNGPLRGLASGNLIASWGAAGWILATDSAPRAAGIPSSYPSSPSLPLVEVILWVFLLIVQLPILYGVHEGGHLACCLVLRVRVLSVSAGILPFPARFSVNGVRVDLGYSRSKPARVRHAGATGWRDSAIIAAGPGANLIAGGLFAAIGLALPPGPAQPASLLQPAQPLRPEQFVQSFFYALAVVSAAFVLVNLMPMRDKRGRLSDGANLLARPAIHRTVRRVKELAADPGWGASDGDVTNLVRAAFRLRVPFGGSEGVSALGTVLAQAGRTRDLLKIHRVIGGFWNDPQASPKKVASAVNGVEWQILIVPGLSGTVADEAVVQLERALRYIKDTDQRRAAVEHTLALAYLRQGRFTDVEPFCRSGLEDALPPAERARVLATVAMARGMLGQPYQEMLAEAMRLGPDAELVKEAVGRAPTPAGLPGAAGAGRRGALVYGVNQPHLPVWGGRVLPVHAKRCNSCPISGR